MLAGQQASEDMGYSLVQDTVRREQHCSTEEGIPAEREVPSIRAAADADIPEERHSLQIISFLILWHTQLHSDFLKHFLALTIELKITVSISNSTVSLFGIELKSVYTKN